MWNSEDPGLLRLKGEIFADNLKRWDVIRNPQLRSDLKANIPLFIAVTIAAALALGLLVFWPWDDENTSVATDMSTPVEDEPSKPGTNPIPPATPPAAQPEEALKVPSPNK